jgi:hypothetical protein
MPRGAQSGFDDAWQRQAWTHYDTCGEFRFGVTWLAKVVSQIRFFPVDYAGAEIDAGLAPALMRALAAPYTDITRLVYAMCVQFTVSGEGYLIKEPGGSWGVYSASEIVQSGSVFQISNGRFGSRRLSTDTAIVRFLRPHPQYGYRVDAPGRSALPVLDQISLLSRHVDAVASSRLASSGLLLYPTECTFPSRPENLDAADPFSTEFIEAASTALRTPGSAASVVPIPLQVPAEHIDKFRHVDFATSYDENVIGLLNNAIGRLAAALDIPGEILTGMGKTTFSNSWQISEDAVRSHVLPLARLIADTLWAGYLDERAGDTAAGIGIDATEVTVGSDKSALALELFDRQAISADALRRESGFDDADAPEVSP